MVLCSRRNKSIVVSLYSTYMLLLCTYNHFVYGSNSISSEDYRPCNRKYYQKHYPQVPLANCDNMSFLADDEHDSLQALESNCVTKPEAELVPRKFGKYGSKSGDDKYGSKGYDDTSSSASRSSSVDSGGNNSHNNVSCSIITRNKYSQRSRKFGNSNIESTSSTLTASTIAQFEKMSQSTIDSITSHPDGIGHHHQLNQQEDRTQLKRLLLETKLNILNAINASKLQAEAADNDTKFNNVAGDAISAYHGSGSGASSSGLNRIVIEELDREAVTTEDNRISNSVFLRRMEDQGCFSTVASKSLHESQVAGMHAMQVNSDQQGHDRRNENKAQKARRSTGELNEFA